MNNHETGRERGDYFDPEEYFGPDVSRYAVFATLPDKLMLNTNELALYMGCSPRTIYRWVACGFLPPSDKRVWIVKRIRDWIDKRCEMLEVEAKAEISRVSNFEFRK